MKKVDGPAKAGDPSKAAAPAPAPASGVQKPKKKKNKKNKKKKNTELKLQITVSTPGPVFFFFFFFGSQLKKEIPPTTPKPAEKPVFQWSSEEVFGWAKTLNITEGDAMKLKTAGVIGQDLLQYSLDDYEMVCHLQRAPAHRVMQALKPLLEK